jgi:hypothetical protein
MNKVCHCGVSFEDKTSNHNRLYCSPRCRVKAWRTVHPEHKRTDASYFQENKKTLQKKRTSRHRDRYQSDVQYRLKDILRSRLHKALKKNLKTGSAINDLGCSVEELRLYLENKFKPGMTWDNQGKGRNKWNIDHIIPLHKFDLLDPEQLRAACHYTNLQPIWEEEHYEKTRNDR